MMLQSPVCLDPNVKKLLCDGWNMQYGFFAESKKAWQSGCISSLPQNLIEPDRLVACAPKPLLEETSEKTRYNHPLLILCRP